jgi:hypothetical protein
LEGFGASFSLKHPVTLMALQLRLDMNTFVIAGPNTITTTVGTEVGGSLAFGGTQEPML